jgi:hypothetical protein
LASFVDPKQSFGPDKIIPPSVLSGAKVGFFCLIPSELLWAKEGADAV